MKEKETTGLLDAENQTNESAGTENESAESSPPQNEELVGIIQRFAPDADTSTPEALNESALIVLKSMVPIYDKMYDVALGSPESAAFLNDLLETGDVAKSLARNYDPDELVALWEEVTDESNEEDRTKHSEKVTKAKDQMAKVKANMDISMQAISDFMEERKHWPAEKADKFEQQVIQFYQDGADGLITAEAIAMLEKAFNYDNDVAEAEETGKIIGQNEKIVAKKLSREKEKELLPELNGGSVIPESTGSKEDSLVAGLRKIADKKPVLG